MSDLPLWLQILLAIGPAVAVYAGIRADLREALTEARNARDSATRAHERIDTVLQDR